MNYEKLKSNKAFTLEDAAVAIVIIFICAGTVSATFIAIYEIQAETKVDSIAMLFVVQIMERIDKLSYNEVQESTIDSVISSMRADFKIPNSFNVNIEIEPDKITNDLVKTVNVKLEYKFNNKNRWILVKVLKVKEFKET